MSGGPPKLAQRAILLAAIAVVTILGVAGSRTWQTYHGAFEMAAQSQRHTVELLKANVEATFQSVDIILDRAAAELVEPDQAAAQLPIVERFARMMNPWDFAFGMSYAGPDGILRESVRRENGEMIKNTVAIDRSTTPLFTVHRDGLVPPGKIYISDPYRAQITNRWIVAVTKAVRGPDGSFRGVVILTLTLDNFARMLGNAASDPFLGLGLFKSDGAVLFTIPENNQIGRTYAGTQMFTRLRGGQDEGVYRVLVGDPPKERQIAFTASHRYPFAIAFGVTSATILRPWIRASLAYALAAGLGILMILALTVWLLHQIRAESEAQERIRDSERRLRESQRIAGVGHYERDIAAERTYWADNMYELHGVTPEQYPDGRAAMLALIHPDERADLIESLRKQWSSGVTTGSSERRIIRPDGQVRRIHYEWRMIAGLEPGKERLFGVAHDVTAIREAEAALRDNEQRLRDLLECSSDFIWETDAKGFVRLFAGQGAERFQHTIGVHGSTHEAIELVDEDSDLLQFRNCIAARESFRNLTIPLRASDGETRWLRSSGNPVFDAAGVFQGYRGVGADVTEIRRQRQIDEERRKAEALGRLASGIAHEINNLLQPIIIYSAFGGGDQQTGESQKRYFARIGRAAEAASMIVRNVLSFVRQRPPNRENVEVAAALRETLDLLGDTLPSAIAREVNSPRACIVDVDRSGLAQVLTNLITNAAEAMPDGGTLRISGEPVDVAGEQAQALGIAPGAYCALTVADTGAGIPPEQIAKVFDPFFTTKAQGKGTGLGLSVVAGHVKSWGGAAVVSSTIGSGTTFTLYLPVAQPQMMAAQ